MECVPINVESKSNDNLRLGADLISFNNICRICLERDLKHTPIFDPITYISKQLMACASVQVYEGDGLPANICANCLARLDIALQFKTQCEDADAKLRSYLNHFQPLENIGDIDNKQIIAQNTIEQDTITADVKAEENENRIENDSKFQILTNLILPYPTQPQCKQDKRYKLRKDHQCDTCNKLFKSKTSLKHHIRIHTGERPYACRICDKRFNNSGHLHTHMRLHTGEKNHICSRCPKAFSTAQQLTKHIIAVHTSERPYSCTYCAKRFANSSNLTTHTKIHTGEKNYFCHQCGKGFCTKGQLDQHMLVHTGEKAHLCDYCEKRFSQKAHLVRHLKMHQKTIKDK